MVNHLLYPKVISNVKLTLQQRRHKQPIYCDRGAKDSKSEMWCGFDLYHVTQSALKRKLVVVRERYAPE